MEIYFAKLEFFEERKINRPFPPIKTGDVTIEKRSIPRAPSKGFANDAHIKIAAYKKPQGKRAVIIPSDAEWERGEYLIILFTILFKNIPCLFVSFFIKKITCMTATIAITIDSFFAEIFKKLLKKREPNIPDINPITVYDIDLAAKYCHVFF